MNKILLNILAQILNTITTYNGTPASSFWDEMCRRIPTMLSVYESLNKNVQTVSNNQTKVAPRHIVRS
jgi:uncharacterized membrane protein